MKSHLMARRIPIRNRLGKALHEQYNVRSVKDITSCNTCHR